MNIQIRDYDRTVKRGYVAAAPFQKGVMVMNYTKNQEGKHLSEDYEDILLRTERRIELRLEDLQLLKTQIEEERRSLAVRKYDLFGM